MALSNKQSYLQAVIMIKMAFWLWKMEVSKILKGDSLGSMDMMKMGAIMMDLLTYLAIRVLKKAKHRKIKFRQKIKVK